MKIRLADDFLFYYPVMHRAFFASINQRPVQIDMLSFRKKI